MVRDVLHTYPLATAPPTHSNYMATVTIETEITDNAHL